MKDQWKTPFMLANTDKDWMDKDILCSDSKYPFKNEGYEKCNITFGIFIAEMDGNDPFIYIPRNNRGELTFYGIINGVAHQSAEYRNKMNNLLTAKHGAPPTAADLDKFVNNRRVPMGTLLEFLFKVISIDESIFEQIEDLDTMVVDDNFYYVIHLAFKPSFIDSTNNFIDGKWIKLTELSNYLKNYNNSNQSLESGIQHIDMYGMW